jgi:rhamnose utilization protein RhaD (predicted bifunctional aldolase and dehydrogenase)
MDGAEPITTALPLARPVSRWSRAEAQDMSEAELLVYRSRLLGADLAVTNFGGGNTSAKIEEADPITGAPVRVLWVKGSGGDLGSIAGGGFSRLYQDKLTALEAQFAGPADEDKMAGLYP